MLVVLGTVLAVVIILILPYKVKSNNSKQTTIICLLQCIAIEGVAVVAMLAYTFIAF